MAIFKQKCLSFCYFLVLLCLLYRSAGENLHSKEKKSGRNPCAGSRVLLRSYDNANAEGGVACSNANNGSSDSWTNNGSRLANIKLCPKDIYVYNRLSGMGYYRRGIAPYYTDFSEVKNKGQNGGAISRNILYIFVENGKPYRMKAYILVFIEGVNNNY